MSRDSATQIITGVGFRDLLEDDNELGEGVPFETDAAIGEVHSSRRGKDGSNVLPLGKVFASFGS